MGTCLMIGRWRLWNHANMNKMVCTVEWSGNMDSLSAFIEGAIFSECWRTFVLQNQKRKSTEFMWTINRIHVYKGNSKRRRNFNNIQIMFALFHHNHETTPFCESHFFPVDKIACFITIMRLNFLVRLISYLWTKSWTKSYSPQISPLHVMSALMHTHNCFSNLHLIF